jgi:hypothetical protein
VQPGQIEFDNVSVGETQTRSIVVKNLRTTNRSLVVNETQLTGKHPEQFAIVNGTGETFTLEPGEQQRIEIRFTPETPGEKSAQLQIVSNAEVTQIDVWLSNTREYLVVQEVAIDRDSEEQPVNIDGNFIQEDRDLVVDISRPSITPLSANIEMMEMTVTQSGNFSMNVTHSPNPMQEDAVITADGRMPLQYVSVNYSVPSQTFEETSFVFTVDKAAVPAGTDPGEINFSRYSDGAWQTQNTTLVSETESTYRFQATTNGFSQFVITGPATDESSSCELFGLNYGSFIVCWYWWVLAAALVVLLVAYRVRRE